MATAKHLDILKTNVQKWNDWRKRNNDRRIDLRETTLDGLNLSYANLSGVLLARASLAGTRLVNANLRGAKMTAVNLTEADLSGADLYRSNLHRGALKGARLIKTNFTKSNLSRSDLSQTIMSRSDFGGADLSGAGLWQAVLYETLLGDTNLMDAQGLNTCRHHGPSTVDHRTVIKSGYLPIEFLRGCGLPDELISHYEAYLSNGLRTQTCLVSCSESDMPFAQKLHDDLQDQGIRCWVIPEELKSGMELQIQVSQALRPQDKLILVLSDHSMVSDWIMQEIQTTREMEQQERRRVLFPVSVANPSMLQSWTLMEPGSFVNLAKEMRQHHIPSFHDMHHQPSYRAALSELVQALRTTPQTGLTPVSERNTNSFSAL